MRGYACYLLCLQQTQHAALKLTPRTYVGISTDVARRLRQHNGELVGGATSTRLARGHSGVWVLHGFVTGFPDRSIATRFESAVKKARPLAVGLGQRRGRMSTMAREWSTTQQLALAWCDAEDLPPPLLRRKITKSDEGLDHSLTMPEISAAPPTRERRQTRRTPKFAEAPGGTASSKTIMVMKSPPLAKTVEASPARKKRQQTTVPAVEPVVEKSVTYTATETTRTRKRKAAVVGTVMAPTAAKTPVGEAKLAQSLLAESEALPPRPVQQQRGAAKSGLEGKQPSIVIDAPSADRATQKPTRRGRKALTAA